jgi:hypothetical protein
MRDINNEVAAWNEFEELPERLIGFKEVILENSDTPLIVVGDNRGLLSAALSGDRHVTLVRHRDELDAVKVAKLNETLEIYSRGQTVERLFIPTHPMANGKYDYFETSLMNPDFFELLTREVTLVANGVLANFYSQNWGGNFPQGLSMTWLDRLNMTGLTRILIRNSGQGLLNSASREAAYLKKRGWPSAIPNNKYLKVSRNRDLVAESGE